MRHSLLRKPPWHQLATDLSNIYRYLNDQVENTRNELIQKQSGQQEHYNRSTRNPSIQKNVVRTNKADITEQKDANHVRTQLEGNKRLDYAIAQRQQKNFKDKFVRTMDYKNRLGQLYRHKVSRYYGHANERSTQVTRTGDLQTVPDYEYRRPYSEKSMIRPNSKQTFKRRAIDYYINGGDAGTDALRSDVIVSSEHQVPRFFVPVAKTAEAQADVLAPVRWAQKQSMGMSDKVPTGYQKTTTSQGTSSGKSYTNPWQSPYYFE